MQDATDDAVSGQDPKITEACITYSIGRHATSRLPSRIAKQVAKRRRKLMQLVEQSRRLIFPSGEHAVHGANITLARERSTPMHHAGVVEHREVAACHSISLVSRAVVASTSSSTCDGMSVFRL